MTVQTLNSIRTEESFDSFWLKVNRLIEDHDISKPELPQQKNDQGDMKKDHMMGIFMNHQKNVSSSIILKLDLIINCFLNRFDQPGYKFIHLWGLS